MKIAPSVLAADFADLAAAVAEVEAEADLLHLDVMDGHFVPNLTFGWPMIEALRKRSELRFDCHMMTSNPVRYLSDLVEAGADLITVHLEAVPDPSAAYDEAERLGVDLGIVISPPTPFEAMEPFLERASLALIMSVHPGFGGQSFMPEALPKVEAARKWVDSHGLDTDIEIDGGINSETAASAHSAGANVLVAGSAVFGAPDRSEAIRQLRRSALVRQP